MASNSHLTSRKPQTVVRVLRVRLYPGIAANGQ